MKSYMTSNMMLDMNLNVISDIQFPLMPMGVLPPPICARLTMSSLWCMFLQTSRRTPQKSFPKFQNPSTTFKFQNPGTSPNSRKVSTRERERGTMIINSGPYILPEMRTHLALTKIWYASWHEIWHSFQNLCLDLLEFYCVAYKNQIWKVWQIWFWISNLLSKYLTSRK